MRRRRRREVEVSRIGTFQADGYFSASFHGTRVMHLELDFLHKGYPRRIHQAEWTEPDSTPVQVPQDLAWPQVLTRLLASPNICSREGLIRQYDHELT